MSRPASRASSAKGKKGKKEKPKPPKKVIAELTELNEQLTQELDKLKTEAEQMRSKIDLVTKKIIDGTNKKELQKLYRIDDQTDLFMLTTDVLLDMVNKLIVRRNIQEKSVESRVEDLETRVTEMSLDIAKMTAKTMAYETGIRDISKSSDIEEIKDKLYHLTLIAGQEYHTFTANDPVHIEKHFPQPPYSNGDVMDSRTKRSLNNALQLNLIPPKGSYSSVRGAGGGAASTSTIPEHKTLKTAGTQRPAKRFPGETHICSMHGDLRLYVIKELSIEKASGADWRMLAERVGIPADTVTSWRELRLECPMGRVLAEWGDSQAATVRMLHRHLVSPQMRCTLLARRVADFYTVDFG